MTHDGPTRRRLLVAGSAALLSGLAGCTADGLLDGEPTENTTTEGTTATTEPTSTAASSVTDEATGSDEPTTADEPATTDDPATTDEPVTPHGETHIHGTLRLEIDGTAYQFGDKAWNDEEQTGNPHFHFHTDDGSADQWHVHSLDVTLGYAADAMPEFDLTATSVTYHGHTYRDEWPSTSVSVTVNDTPLPDPRSYRLRDGDAVLVTVETDRPTPTPTTGGSDPGAGGNATGGGNATAEASG